MNLGSYSVGAALGIPQFLQIAAGSDTYPVNSAQCQECHRHGLDFIISSRKASKLLDVSSRPKTLSLETNKNPGVGSVTF